MFDLGDVPVCLAPSLRLPSLLWPGRAEHGCTVSGTNLPCCDEPRPWGTVSVPGVVKAVTHLCSDMALTADSSFLSCS